MIDNKKIIDFLNELVKKRNNEQIQNQELNNWSEAEDCYYQDRTDDIYKTIEELETKTTECKILTLDEAIQHANDIANTNETLCSKNHKQLADWLIELKNLKNSYAYLAADFDNYRKRIAKNEIQTYDNATKNVISRFLTIYDDMERICKSFKISLNENDDKDKNIIGFRLIFENIEKILNSFDCKKIICEIGDKFDVDYMEAISTKEVQENDGYRPDDVVEIYQSGWKFKDSLIRPVKVIVGK